MELVVTLLLGLLGLLLLVLVKHLRQNKGSLEALGIPVVPPALPLLGSPPYVVHKTLYHDYIKKNHEKMGKTYGRYDGIIPTISTIDPDLIRSVLVKNAESFQSTFDVEISDDRLTLDIAGGKKWYALRKILSPTFTSGKLKGMLEPIKSVIDDMMNFIEGKEGQEVDMKEIFQGLSTNAICRCAFGVEVDAHHNQDDELIRYGRQAFEEFRPKNWTETLFFHAFLYFPRLDKVLDFIPESFEKIRIISKRILEDRKRNNLKTNDFLSHLDDLMEKKKTNPEADQFKDISVDNLMAQAIIFFIAGYETTANTLSTTCYHLAKFPEIQEKLLEEVDGVLDSLNENDSSENLSSKLPYMEAVIAEDLRMVGPFHFQIRTCTRDCEVLPGMLIKKGTRVEMPIFASHHTAEFFPDPEAFKPERFFKENADSIIPYTYRPFGGGQRVCIGQRFAQVEMKHALVKLLAKYKLVATANTRLDFNSGDPFFISYADMKVKLEPRNA